MTDSPREDASAWSVPMREAIDLADAGAWAMGGNPRVGCVVLDGSGAVVGRGSHQGAGTPHAEVVALAEAGEQARGGTAVVTLEPCRHTGRTGPCTEALITAGVARVVFAVADPTDSAGGGVADLRRAGIEVVSGVEEPDARWVARAWLSSVERRRPWVTIKAAVSLDGRVADVTGGPTPITGPAAREVSHQWRSRVDAIVVGTGTALADDPQLTSREVNGDIRSVQPLRVVVGRTPLPSEARVLDGTADTWVFADRDLTRLLEELHERGVQHVLVEGGPTLEGALLEAGLADEILWFVAPVILGGGPAALPPLERDVDVHVRRTRVVGEDVVWEGVIGVHGNR